MPQNLPEQIQQRIVRLKSGEVARMLGVSQGCISKIMRHNRETARPHQRKRGGSMKISTPREDRQLLRMVRMNHFFSAPRLRMQTIGRFGRRMSVRTIRRRLLAAGFWSRRPARCPRLTLEHRRRRREWGRRHRVWDLRQWRNCIFSDESRFSLYHSHCDGRVQVRRRQGERLIDACVQPNNGNRGPSVMVWVAIHNGGRSELVVVDEAMNRYRYIQILRNQMLPWATGVFGHNFVYVQDNAPPNTARDTAVFFDQQNVEFIGWPARSPDMNPIEHVWDQMSVLIRDMDDPASTVAELNNAVRQAWAAFGQEGCGSWSRACLVVLGLFWPLEAGTHATSVEVRRAKSCSTNM